MTRTAIMGIVNVTPDSFSGDGVAPQGSYGGDYVQAAVTQARQMIEDGATMLDIGGESSRPGASPVTAEEECRRVVPVIEAIRRADSAVPISIDTVKADVARRALQAGATIINDISAMTYDPAMAGLAASSRAPVILMHNRAGAVRHDAKIGGTFDAPEYSDVVAAVTGDLRISVDRALQAGIEKSRIILDPGIGFGKTPPQNVALIARLDRVKALGFPVLMGVSRKSFIGLVTGSAVEDRLAGTAACVAVCILNGADMIRVHDVKFMAQLARMAEALRDG